MGKLKGIAVMGNVEKYSTQTEELLDQSAYFIIHEISHHWSGRAKFKDQDGNISTALLKEEESLDHWSMYNDFISPLGGSGWLDNGDGTFTNKLSKSSNIRRQYSDLDLYFMNLLPKQMISPIKYLVPDQKDGSGNILSGYMEKVTIDQIIDVMGNSTCYIL